MVNVTFYERKLKAIKERISMELPIRQQLAQKVEAAEQRNSRELPAFRSELKRQDKKLEGLEKARKNCAFQLKSKRKLSAAARRKHPRKKGRRRGLYRSRRHSDG